MSYERIRLWRSLAAARAGRSPRRAVLYTRGMAAGVASTCEPGSRAASAPHGITDTQGAAWRCAARPYSSSTAEPMNPNTIVLIHGFWVTPRSWEHWKAYYEQQGYRAHPAYPGFEVEVESLNADLTLPGEPKRARRHRPPHRRDRRPGAAAHPDGPLRWRVFIIMLDRGYGAVGVTINSAPTEGVPVVPLSQLKSTFPGASNGRAQEGSRASPSSSGATRSPTPSPRRSPGRCTSATTSRRR